MEKPGLKQAKVVLVKKFGPRLMGSSERIAIADKRVTTGSMFLDICLAGGIPVGRTTALWGERSGGKTTTACRIAGIFQTLCRNCWRPAKNIVAVPPSEEELAEDPDTRWTATGECDCYATGQCDTILMPPPKETKEGVVAHRERVEEWTNRMKANSYEETVVAYIDAENSFSREYFAYFGDPRRLLLTVPETGEEALDVAEALACSGAIDLMVLDSLAHFAPRDEIEKSMDEWQQGLQARILNKGIRKLVGRASKAQRSSRRITQIWINQKRMKIQAFGDPNVKPGGMGQDFAAHVEIKFDAGKMECVDDKFGAKEDVVKVPVEETFSFTVKKQKTGDQGTKDMKGWYVQSSVNNNTYKVGQVKEDDFIFKMVMSKLAKDVKNGYEVFGREFTTQKAIKDAIDSDVEFRAAVRDAILAHYKTKEKE